MEKKICIPRVLKNIAYVLFPIFATILVLLIFCLSYPLERESIKAGVDFYDTNTFAEDYAKEIFGSLTTVDVLKDNYQTDAYSYYYSHTETVENNDEVKSINYYTDYNGSNVVWLVLDNDTKIAYTNLNYSLDTSTIDNIKNKIMGNSQNWKYHDGSIQTTIEKLSNENIEYIDSTLNQEDIEMLGNTEQSSESNNKQNNVIDSETASNGQNANLKNNYTIYTALLDDMEYVDNIYRDRLLYNTLSIVNQNLVFLIPFLIGLIIALIPIIVIGIGRTRKQEGINLNWFDKILIEFAASISIFIGCIGAVFTVSIGGASTIVTFTLAISIMAVGILIMYLACILFFETVVKRVKTHTFIKTTFAYWIYIKIKGFMLELKITKRFVLYFIAFILANLFTFAIMWSDGFPGIVLTIILYVIAFSYITKRIKSYSKIEDAISKLYKGDTDMRLDEKELCKEMQETGKQINDIAGGLSNAINEKLKSERLKTELITNVSHDIKTPLTSIINYVDLLKKEDEQGEKAKEYLDILDSKSQRLKKLTEDLVEASKASSGAIKLNIERLNVNELIKQVSGEFEDKFKSHNLHEIITFPESDVYINADSRYMYRVLENMYSNISKYAMEGTRVYTDIAEKDGDVIIQIKNVSKQKLNISADELMQRFVRGEASRNTEGSGLGLSIARSLTELQQGKFNIYLDGDLFKVTIEFKKN